MTKMKPLITINDSVIFSWIINKCIGCYSLSNGHILQLTWGVDNIMR